MHPIHPTHPSAPPADPRLRADPLADDIVHRILCGPDTGTPSLSRWDAIAVVERALAAWDSNGALDGWRADAGTPAPIAAALEDYIKQARRLPAWLDAGKVARAEAVFACLGTVSFTLLACAAVPEADMAAGAVEPHPDDRVRAAAALMLAAMLPGGLLDPAGSGVAQVLALRLRNALVRHLVVRGHPGEALTYGAAIPALLPEGADPHRTLFARGWDVRVDGLPRNQEALAYTLLGFHYVMLRSLRRLGLGLRRQDEDAWLHAWNVAGHLLGIEEDLLAPRMREAATLFERLQRHARAVADARYAVPGRKGGAPAWGKAPDPRPALAAGLVRALREGIRRRALQALPLLLARRLCARATARALGLDAQAPLLARALFSLGLGAARAADSATGLFDPGVSILRLAARILGYRIALRFLTDPALPESLLRQVDAALGAWETNPAAPGWVNAIEARLRPRRPRIGPGQAAAC
ncbi:DUF2236 domain-containing protein [Massilia jejuensis]|uniref:DUF2236 domain-containing protein n=1 Tax=Massilia jejuensis TaxID=648894 RepID=A0ABW0PPJ4_9BURK